MCSRVLPCVFTVWLISEKPSMDLLPIKKVLTTGGVHTKAGFPIPDQAWWAIRTALSFWSLSGTILHLHLVWQHFKEAPYRPYTDDTVFPNGLQLFALVNPIIPEPRLQTQMRDFLMLPILDSNQTNRVLLMNNVINCCKSNGVSWEKRFQKATWV